ncbi:NaeI family type II restriction endonuclease [Streptomyces sp. NPDC019890]|uniref:NaeI family type II restriction endonuclease n=1 Tax=Streptomyces sp. NPDC019890 TaxID=3365064 RepID=UPI003850BE88
MREQSLARAVAALSAAAPELDGTALADALWLASRLAGDGEAASAGPEPHQPAEAAPAPEPVAESSAPAGAGAAAPERALHERLAGASSRVRGDAVAPSRAAGLPLALEVTRALRPWKRPWRQGRRPELDIDATVDGYARSGELIPALRAAPERWFDLVLVVDRSPAMQVWQETIADFTAVLDRLGAFRTLQVRDLGFGEEGPELRDGQGRLTGPGQLRSPDGRRLVVAVSDCAAPGWREPGVWRQLREWSLSTPVALLNPLPTKLWRRTGLDLPTVRVAPGTPGSVNSHLAFDPPPLLPNSDDGPWLPIPVLSLSPHSLGRWSRTLMRTAPEGCGAVLVPSGGRPEARPRRRSGTGNAEGFLRTASPAAARLAVLCSAFDRLSMRLLHLIRQELVPEATVADVAELLTSGLFALGSDAGGTVELALPDTVQQRLRRELAEHEVWRINRALSRHVSSRGNGGGQLPSVAYAPEGAAELPAERKPFAQASRRTLELLGLPVEEAERHEERAGRPVPAHLPPDSAENFVGRARPLQDLQHFITSPGSPVVSVTADGGAPGAGKTTLALRAAHLVKDHFFPDGQLFVDLRGSSTHPLDPSSVLVGFLQALGASLESLPSDQERLSALYRASMAGRRVLVVLDNAHAESQVAPLLPDTGTPGCAVVITSRGPILGLSTHVLQLGPLDDTEGVNLISSIVGRARNYVVFDDGVQLVRRYGGWPLPIALIAKWIALGDVPSGLALELRHEGPVGSALDVALKLRLDHLEPWLARAVMLLAMLDTTQLQTGETAAVLNTTHGDAVETLQTLVETGLLESDGAVGSHYRFHDEVQRVARRRARAEIPTNQAELAAERLLRHYRREAVRVCTGDRPGDRLADRLGLIGSGEAAVAPGMSLESFLGESPDVLTVMGAAELGRRVAPHVRAHVLLLLRDLAESPLHAAQYRSAALSVAEDAQRIEDSLTHARAQVALALGLLHQNQDAEAQVTLEAAAAQNDAATAGIVDLLFGIVAQRQGDYPRAAAHFERSAATAASDRDRFAEAQALDRLAHLNLELGQAHEAIDAVNRQLKLLREVGAPLRRAHALCVLAEGHAQLGQHAIALSCLQDALGLFRAHAQHEAVGSTGLRIAQTHLAAGNLAAALAAAEDSLAVLAGTGNASHQADALIVLGHALHHAGEADRARQRWHEALALFLTTADGGGRVAELQGLLRTDGAAPLSRRHHNTVVAVEIQDFAAHRNADRTVLLETLDEVLGSQRRPCLWDGTIVLAFDWDIPVERLLVALVDRLPRALDALNRRLAVRVAVHSGIVDSVVSSPAVDTALTLLRTPDLDRIARSSGASCAVCVSATAMEAALQHPGTSLSTERFAKIRLTDGGETLRAWLHIPEPAPPVDEELQRLREAFMTEDPDGHRMGKLLRDCIDKILDGPGTGRFDVEELTPDEFGRLARSVELAVLEDFPLLPLPDVGFFIRFGLNGPRGAVAPVVQNAICLILDANDRESKWWAGLKRVRSGSQVDAVNQDGERVIELDRSVEWLHRNADLPENLLLQLPEPVRTAILSASTGAARAAELFRRVTERRISTETLRTVTQHLDYAKRIRDARRVLSEEGIVILSHLPQDRERARALGLPVPEPGEWVSCRAP